MMGLCYIAAFGFTTSPKARAGHGMFDHERPQAVQDAMDKQRNLEMDIKKADK
jgi:hypothetical protein